MNCLHCAAETSNGLALCEACRAAASVYLEFLPVYFRNLARWRPGRAGARPVPGSREPRGPSPLSVDRVSQALDEAGADIIGWARTLHDDRGVEVPVSDDEAGSVIAASRMLLENLTSIATLEWVGEFVRVIRHHESRLRWLTVDIIPGWYAGACSRCGVPTYVVPGLSWVTCGGCGATTYARDHLETILNEARGWAGRPRRVAETIVALVDTELSVERLYERIKKWEQRGKLSAVRRVDLDGDEVGPKSYRLGDVLDLVFREGQTRTNEVIAKAS